MVGLAQMAANKKISGIKKKKKVDWKKGKANTEESEKSMD